METFIKLFTSYQGVNVLGLICDIIGALILFKSGGLPAGVLIWGENALQKVNKDKKLAKLGVVLLIIGFMLQLIATLLSVK